MARTLIFAALYFIVALLIAFGDELGHYRNLIRVALIPIAVYFYLKFAYHFFTSGKS